jgi:hypothetical protein
MLQQGSLNVGNIPFFSEAEPIQDRGGIANGSKKFDLWDIEFLRSLDEDISRDALAAELLSHLLGDFFSATV